MYVCTVSTVIDLQLLILSLLTIFSQKNSFAV